MLTQEEIQKYRQKYNIGTKTESSPVKRVAELRSKAGQKQQIEEYRQSPEGQSFLDKFSNISGKILGGLSKFTGIKAGVEAVAPAAEQFAQIGSKLQGEMGEKFREKRLLGEQGEVIKKTEEESIGSGIKQLSGNLLEIGTMSVPATKTSSVLLKTPQYFKNFASKFPKLASYSKLGGMGAGYGASFGTAKGLQENKDIIKEAIQGAATGALLTVAVPALVEGTVRAVKNVVPLYSGVPKEALEQAFNNPKKVREAVKQFAKDPDDTKIVLKHAEDAFDTIKKVRADNYQKALKSIQDDIMITKTGPNTGRLYIRNPETNVLQPTKITLKGVKSKLTSTLKDFNIKILSNTEQKQITELKSLVNNWDDITPLGLNDLRRSFRNRVNIGNSKELNAIVNRLEKNLSNYINKRIPQIGEMNKAYYEASNFINDLQQEIFGKTKSMKDSTKLNRLLKIFESKSDVRQNLVQELGEKAGIDLINEITGAALSSWMPVNWVNRFILAGGALGAGLGNAALLPAAIAGASPRIVGKAARTLGNIKNIIPLSKRYGIPISSKVINKND